MLSSKRRFSNPAFQNSVSNPYIWGVKTRVSKFGFKIDIENPKLEKLNFCSILIGPIINCQKIFFRNKLRNYSSQKCNDMHSISKGLNEKKTVWIFKEKSYSVVFHIFIFSWISSGVCDFTKLIINMKEENKTFLYSNMPFSYCFQIKSCS